MDYRLGTGVINHNGGEILVLYSNRAIAEAESMMGKGIIGVLNGFENGQSGVKEVAVLFSAGMDAARRYYRLGGKRASLQDAYDLMDQIGFTVVAAEVFQAVSEVIAHSGDDNQDETEDSESEKNQ